jgi:cytochrome c2
MREFLFIVLLSAATMVSAQQHPLFKDADFQAGEKLIAENQCNECHIRRVGGNGMAAAA